MNTTIATTPKVHNFSAGPAILPQEVLAKAAEAFYHLTKIYGGQNLKIL
jgi:phosphoserine aminotransferase